MSLLTFQSLQRLLAMGCWLSMGLIPLQAQTADIRGVIRGAQGQAVLGASVTLQCGVVAPSAAEEKTESGAEGEYSFVGVGTLPCRLHASAAGLTATVDLDLTKAVPGQVVHAPDLILLAHAPQLAAHTDILTTAPPKFEASGIRGLIDPGGYSAPASAAAASALLSGMADVRRTGSAFNVGATTDSCASMPSLLHAFHEQPGSVEANRRLGNFYLVHGQAALALPYLKFAHIAAPSDVAITLELARTEIAQEQFAAARAALAVVPVEAASADVHVLMAQAEEGLGLFADAAMQYGLAQEQNASAENVFGHGYELILMGRPTAADEVFRESLKRSPHSVRLLEGRGISEYLAGRNAVAVETFLEAIAADPANSEAYPFLVQAYLVSGEHGDQVRTLIRDHLARATDDGTAHYLMALVLSRFSASGTHGNDKEVALLLQQAITLEPGLALAHFRLGVLKAWRNDNEAAAMEFEQAARLQPTLAEAHFRLAGIYRKLGRTEASAQEVATFKRLRPSGDAHEEDAGVDLRQFVSVMHKSQPKPAVEVCQ